METVIKDPAVREIAFTLKKALQRVAERHREIEPFTEEIISAFVEECQREPEKIKSLYGDKDREELLKQFEEIMEKKLEKLKAEMEKKIDESKDQTLDQVLDWFRQTAKGIQGNADVLAEALGETRGYAKVVADYLVKNRQVEIKLEELEQRLKYDIKEIVDPEPEWLKIARRENPGLTITKSR